MFNSEIQVVGTRVSEPNEENETIEIGVLTGLPLPIPQLPMVIDGFYRWSLKKQNALDFAAAIKEKADLLPDEEEESDLVIATNMNDIDRVAKLNSAFKGS